MPPRIRRYPVKRNQTALDIAQELGISSQSLLQANPGVKTLKPGVVLNVPGGIQPLMDAPGVPPSPGQAPKGNPLPPPPPPAVVPPPYAGGYGATPPPAPTGQVPKGWVPPAPAPNYGGYQPGTGWVQPPAQQPAPVYAPPYAGGGYGATPPAPVYAGGGYGATPKINAPRFDQEIATQPQNPAQFLGLATPMALQQAWNQIRMGAGALFPRSPQPVQPLQPLSPFQNWVKGWAEPVGNVVQGVSTALGRGIVGATRGIAASQGIEQVPGNMARGFAAGVAPQPTQTHSPRPAPPSQPQAPPAAAPPTPGGAIIYARDEYGRLFPAYIPQLTATGEITPGDAQKMYQVQAYANATQIARGDKPSFLSANVIPLLKLDQATLEAMGYKLDAQGNAWLMPELGQLGNPEVTQDWNSYGGGYGYPRYARRGYSGGGYGGGGTVRYAPNGQYASPLRKQFT